MVEEKKSYKELRTLSLEEMKHAVSEMGSVLLHALPDDTVFVAKITDEVIVKEKEHDDEGNVTKYTYMVPVEYYHKNLERKPKFNVIISQGCYDNLTKGKQLEDGTVEPPNWTAFPDKTYVGKRAFFKRIKGEQGRKLQFINVFQGGKDPVSVDDMFKQKEAVAEEGKEEEAAVASKPATPPTTPAPGGQVEPLKGASDKAKSLLVGIVQPKVVVTTEVKAIIDDLSRAAKEQNVTLTKEQWQQALQKMSVPPNIALQAIESMLGLK